MEKHTGGACALGCLKSERLIEHPSSDIKQAADIQALSSEEWSKLENKCKSSTQECYSFTAQETGRDCLGKEYGQKRRNPRTEPREGFSH